METEAKATEKQEKDSKDLKMEVLDTFSQVAGSIGYSPVHGKIIGALLIGQEPLSLQELARITGYSTSMVSLSLDLLEVLGVIARVKRSSDRKLYIKLSGDLLECLKKAFIFKLNKSCLETLERFEGYKNRVKYLSPSDKNNVEKIIEGLEKEIKRLNTYINLLKEVKLP